tara:strand:+ start:16 stop:204 length:189 start_codon:yes stop_codon:yes gene_type:complete
MKIQTLGEMEAEDPDIFKNAPPTPAEEAKDAERYKKLAEINAAQEEEEEEEEKEEEEEEEED